MTHKHITDRAFISLQSLIQGIGPEYAWHMNNIENTINRVAVTVAGAALSSVAYLFQYCIPARSQIGSIITAAPECNESAIT